MDWTPKQINALEALLEKQLITKFDDNTPYATKEALKYLYDMIHIFRDSNSEIYRKIEELKKIGDSFDTYTEYSMMYDILYGNYNNLPLYINTPGFCIISQWRMSFMDN